MSATQPSGSKVGEWQLVKDETVANKTETDIKFHAHRNNFAPSIVDVRW